jgi:hypothetical protein
MSYYRRGREIRAIRESMRKPFVSKAMRAKRLAEVRKTFTYDPTFWAVSWLRGALHGAIPRAPRA